MYLDGKLLVKVKASLKYVYHVKNVVELFKMFFGQMPISWVSLTWGCQVSGWVLVSGFRFQVWWLLWLFFVISFAPKWFQLALNCSSQFQEAVVDSSWCSLLPDDFTCLELAPVCLTWLVLIWFENNGESKYKVGFTLMWQPINFIAFHWIELYLF